MPKIKSVLFIANGIMGLNPGVSGGDMRFIEIAKNWGKLGYNLQIFTTDAGQRLCQKLGLKAKFIQSFTAKSVDKFWLVLVTFIFPFLLPRLLSFRSGIVYSCNDMYLDVLPGLFLKLLYGSKITWAVVIHWLPPFPPWKRQGASLLSSTLFFLNQRISLWLAYFFADRLLPVSDSTFHQLIQEKISSNKVKTVECGVNLAKINQLHLKHTPRYEAIFMKRFQAVKGIFDLINIWELVVKKIPTAKLVLIGDGPAENEIKKIVAQKKLTQNIIFAGVIYDPRQKFSYLSQAKLFLLPSYEENWAIVIGEAMATFTPVIAYDLPELQKVWQDKITTVPLGDIHQFSQKIISLLQHPNQRKTLALQAHHFIKRYDWTNIATKELQLIIK